MTPEPSAAPPKQTASFTRELRDFLIQLSIALHRYAMYPEGHPSLAPTVDHVLRLLGEVLAAQESLSLGVARNQLVIEGVATDPKHPVLRDLAARLHKHHLGAVKIGRGAQPNELHEFFKTVAADPDRTGQPVGLDPKFGERVWPHVRFYSLSYDRLRFAHQDTALPADEEARTVRTRAAQLWLGLARAALASDAQPGKSDREVDAEEDIDPTEVAKAIDAHGRDEAYDQVIVGYLLQIAEELKSGQTQESTALRRKVSQMVSSLDRSTMSRLLDMGGDAGQRRWFLLSASEGLAAEAVLDLVQAAADSRTQTVSHSLLRMLQKLARHAEAGQGRRKVTADASMREQVAALIRNWSLKDPNPDEYRVALQRMSTAAPLFATAAEQRYLPEPRRILEMALELDVTGPAVERAVDILLEKGELQPMLDALRAADAPTAARTLRTRLASPGQLERVLAQEPLNVSLVDELLQHLGLGAADVLLDALIGAGSSQTRRLLLSRLVALGSDIGPHVVARLADERWFVVRNMLALLGELPTLPPGFDAATYTSHADGRVRREALRILLRDPATRERAITLGLADPDDHAVRLAITAAARGCPETAIPLLASRATSGGNTDQRTAAIRVLGGAPHAAALETLLTLAAPRRSLLGVKPQPKSPEYLAALAALSRHTQDARVRATLAVAARSRDPDIAAAALGNVDGEP